MGDALVASVPALLLSIAAAVIVTRVSDARDLTGQIGGQFAEPGIWLPVGCILAAMGMIPAMPQSVFLPLAAGAFALVAHAQAAPRPSPRTSSPSRHRDIPPRSRSRTYPNRRW